MTKYLYLFRNSRQLLAPVGIGCVGRARGPRPKGDGHARLLHRRSIPGTHFSFRAKYICASFLQNLHLYLFLQRFRVRSPTSPTYVNNQFHYPVRSDCAGTAAGPPSSSTTFCPVISAGDSSTLRSGTLKGFANRSKSNIFKIVCTNKVRNQFQISLSGETKSALGSADREGCGQDTRVLRGPRVRQGHRGARHADRRALRQRSSAGN